MSRMLKSSGAMGAATMTSRVLGLVREQVYSWFMGSTPVAGAFFLAFQIPNLFRRLLGEGALTAAFIPIFKAKEKNEGEKEMWRASNAVISGLLVVASAVVVVAMLVVTVLLHFSGANPARCLMLELLRMMFPYLILVCLAAICMGMLNARGYFFIPAIGAGVLNVVMIASVLLLAPHMGHTLDAQVFALAIGVLVAGVAQAAFQMPALWREGFRMRWESPWHDPTVREVVRKMIPGSIGVAAFQLNVVMTGWLGYGQNAVIVSDFNYATRLMELPQGVFGISLATYLLPTLAGLATEKKFGEFRTTLRHGVSHLVFVNLLAMIFLLSLAEPMIRLLFQHGKFDSLTTDRVSFALVCLAPGLIMFSLVNIFARAFYALNDIKTPMKISLVCIVVNFAFALVFLFGFKLGGGALGLANSISATLNASLLAWHLRGKLGALEMAEFRRQLPALAAAGVIAVLLTLNLRWLWDGQFGHASLVLKLGEVFAPMILATLVYFAVALWLKIPSAHEIAGLVLERLTGKAGANKG